MVNGPDDVYVEQKGRLEKVTDGLFEGEEAVLHVMGWEIGKGETPPPFASNPSGSSSGSESGSPL
jgi:hypothetical protein